MIGLNLFLKLVFFLNGLSFAAIFCPIKNFKAAFLNDKENFGCIYFDFSRAMAHMFCGSRNYQKKQYDEAVSNYLVTRDILKKLWGDRNVWSKIHKAGLGQDFLEAYLGLANLFIMISQRYFERKEYLKTIDLSLNAFNIGYKLRNKISHFGYQAVFVLAVEAYIRNIVKLQDEGKAFLLQGALSLSLFKFFNASSSAEAVLNVCAVDHGLAQALRDLKKLDILESLLNELGSQIKELLEIKLCKGEFEESRILSEDMSFSSEYLSLDSSYSWADIPVV